MTVHLGVRPRSLLLLGAIGVFGSLFAATCGGERFRGDPILLGSGGNGSITGSGGFSVGSGGLEGGSGGVVFVDAGGGGSGGDGFGNGGTPGSGGSLDAGGSGGSSDVAMDMPPFKDGPSEDASHPPDPPATWMEHWFEHNLLLDLVGSNDDAVVYFDKEMPRIGTEWIVPRVSAAWKYTRQTYGEFRSATSDGRFYAVFHQGQFGGCHGDYYYSGGHDFRNTSDCGAGPWTTEVFGGWAVMMAYMVQFTSNGVTGFPLVNVFSGGRFLEFFQFDLAMALGRTADAGAMSSSFMNNQDTLPQAGSFWFRDWFFPLWRDHGHGQVMARFFKLLALNFPKANGRYSRNMTFGEFVHFMSGAAGTDLKSMAITAFGPGHPSDAELAKARTDFPMITY